MFTVLKFLCLLLPSSRTSSLLSAQARNNFTRISDAVKVAVPSDQRPLVAFISHQDEYISPDYSAPELFSECLPAFFFPRWIKCARYISLPFLC